MRIAIISDIHSNLEALQKTVEIISDRKPDRIICLGDIVGYGANPKECLELTRKISHHILMGNHDQASADVRCASDFSEHAQTAIFWMNKVLLPNEKEFLLSLPLSIKLDNINFVHSSPYQPQEWHYITRHSEASFNFGYFDNPVCFIGHSHVSAIFCEDFNAYRNLGEPLISDNKNYFSLKYQLLREKKYIINVGSVGQPRDRDWRLSFGIFDTETLEYENIRSEYDVESAAKKIIDAKLPRYLADRILIGR